MKRMINEYNKKMRECLDKIENLGNIKADKEHEINKL